MMAQRLTAAAGGLFALALGLLLLLYLIPNYIPSFGSAAGRTLGAADFPRFIAWALLFFGALDTILIMVSGERVEWKPPETISRFLIVGAIILTSLLVIPYLGMLQTGLVMMVVLLMTTAGLRLLPSIAIAVAFSAILFVLFILIMGTPLPHGSLWT
jgi:hypothetical protein